MPIEVPPLTPLSVFERRLDWQLAALIVALVLLPEAPRYFNDASRFVEPARAKAPFALRSGRDPRVRPPRSC